MIARWSGLVFAGMAAMALTPMGVPSPALAEDLPNIEVETLTVTIQPGETCQEAWTKRGNPPAILGGQFDTEGNDLPRPPGVLKPFPSDSEVAQNGDQCVIKVYRPKKKDWCAPGETKCFAPPGESN